MTDYYVNYAVAAVLGVVGILFAAGTLLMWRLLRPSKPTREKLLIYECGIDAIGQTWTQPNIRYYIFAFLFAIFDVVAIFLFPWALVYEQLGLYVVVGMTVFVIVVSLDLAYAWAKGVLDWM